MEVIINKNLKYLFLHISARLDHMYTRNVKILVLLFIAHKNLYVKFWFKKNKLNIKFLHFPFFNTFANKQIYQRGMFFSMKNYQSTCKIIK